MTDITARDALAKALHMAGEFRFAVVFDRPDLDRSYAWGPFSDPDTARRFAEFASQEIDPAHVMPWADAGRLPGVRLSDPVAELLAWRKSVALPQLAARSTTTGEEQPAANITVYRAAYDSISLGLYTSREQARAHCLAEAADSGLELDGTHWVPDSSDPMAPEELHHPGDWGWTGYAVTPLTVHATYHPNTEA